MRAKLTAAANSLGLGSSKGGLARWRHPEDRFRWQSKYFNSDASQSTLSPPRFLASLPPFCVGEDAVREAPA
jgi:hypothetical protein